jgi:hypothetical protein
MSESAFDRTIYDPAVGDLIVEERLMELGPGSPNRRVLPALEALRPEHLFEFGKPKDLELARACVSGLWLYHDFLDESHTISQDLPGVTGSYWHGIMHRREPDASNAKYWFRQVGDHSVYAKLRDAAAELAQFVSDPAAAFLREQPAWDAFAFVDLCERVRDTGTTTETLCRRVQLREWELLFDWCYKRAS